MKIDFNEEKHEYMVGGVHIPSVSEILSPLNADRYGEINREVLRSAAERGKAVHEICEAIDYDIFTSEMEDEMPPELEGYVDAYFQFLFDHDVYWEMVEQIVSFSRFDGELPLYCGTIDRFGIVDGRKAVVDIKTYASMTTEAQMTASCQTALYRDAIIAKPTITGVSGETIDTDSLKHDDEEIPARFILHLKKDGKYRLIDLANFDYNRGWSGATVAGELLHLYYEKQTALAGKKGKK